MNPLLFVLDLLLSFYGTQRLWFWVCFVFIAVGRVARASSWKARNFIRCRWVHKKERPRGDVVSGCERFSGRGGSGISAAEAHLFHRAYVLTCRVSEILKVQITCRYSDDGYKK